MQLVSFQHHGVDKVGVKVGELIFDLSASCPDLPSDMIALIQLGTSGLRRIEQALLRADKMDFIQEHEIVFLSPIPKPGKILCIGHNYAGHIGIGKTENPEFPNMFCKTVNTIIGHNQPVLIPRVSTQVDYEGELAVIIGGRAKDVPESDAMQFVAGYSIFNDVSARDIQKRTSQWFTGKSFDTFGPLGPALVTTDEIPDPHHLNLELRVNGVLKQKTNTQDFIFNVPYLISYLSMVLTLEPGDVIATGTPAKLPEAANPHTFLQPGDVIEVSIEKIGVLCNPVQ